MSVNSSSTFNDLVYHCNKSVLRPYVIISFFAVKTLFILPLCTFILYLGHQQWRQHRSFETASHSDVFTYHVSAMELLWVIGSACFLYGDKNKILPVLQAGLYLSTVTLYGETCFHVLTCVERYLAVVHPVVYLGLRNARGLWIRNVSVAGVWMLCFVILAIYADLKYHRSSIVLFCIMPFCLLIISFCSFSVLRVLIRPGPREGDGGKGRVDQLKQRAFYTIAAISGMLWFWFFGVIIATVLNNLPLLDDNAACAVSASINWFNLPCSLVLPVLHLHRAGKLPCCLNTK